MVALHNHRFIISSNKKIFVFTQLLDEPKLRVPVFLRREVERAPVAQLDRRDARGRDHLHLRRAAERDPQLRRQGQGALQGHDGLLGQLCQDRVGGVCTQSLSLEKKLSRLFMERRQPFLVISELRFRSGIQIGI